MTHYEILPPEQRKVLPLLSPTRDLGFALYGGTAIGLQLGHRQSIDFDFFSDARPTRNDMLSALPHLARAEVLQDEADTWTVLAHASLRGARPVKVSFFSGLTFGRVGTPQLSTDGEILVASLADLLGHKLKVLLQRVETKDYQDIAAMICAGQCLEDGTGAAISLFGSTFPVADALRALVYFDDRNLDALGNDERRVLSNAVAAFSKPKEMPRLSDLLTDVTDRTGRSS